MTTDVTSALTPKSDQLNADDLIGGSIVIEITKVTNIGKGKEQPLIINYKNDDGKPWKPCKTMGRLMVHAWGTTDGAIWVGRKVQLYRDPNIRFGADIPGGIRISHISHITAPLTVALTNARGNRKPFTVQPLMGEVSAHKDESGFKKPVTTSPAELSAWLDDIARSPDEPHLEQKFKAGYRVFKDDPASIARLTEAKDKRKQQLLEKNNANT